MADTYFANVVQLCHFDGSNGSTTFTNSCPRGSTLTATGVGALTTAQMKWGTASFDAQGGTCGASAPASIADYGFGTGDFTFEFWVRLNGVSTSQNMVFFYDNSTVGFYLLNPGQLYYYAGSTNRIISASNSLVANTWHFIAYSRVSANGVMYIDGVSAGSWADTMDYGSTGTMVVGRFSGGSASMVGYIDDLRVTKGVGRYTGGTCAVPTAAFEDTGPPPLPPQSRVVRQATRRAALY